MSDQGTKYKSVAIAAQEITSAWTKIPAGSETGLMSLRASGAFLVATAAVPGAHYMAIPSGVMYDHESVADLYVSSPKNVVLQVRRYS